MCKGPQFLNLKDDRTLVYNACTTSDIMWISWALRCTFTEKWLESRCIDGTMTGLTKGFVFTHGLQHITFYYCRVLQWLQQIRHVSYHSYRENTSGEKLSSYYKNLLSNFEMNIDNSYWRFFFFFTQTNKLYKMLKRSTGCSVISLQEATRINSSSPGQHGTC